MNTIADQDLLQKINSFDMAILVVDRNLNIQLINDSFNRIWTGGVYRFNPGDPFRKLLDINRPSGMSDVPDNTWEDYVALRLSEIQNGEIEPYELEREGDVSLLYSVSTLSDDRRLVSYFEMSSQELDKSQEDDNADGLSDYRSRLQTAIDELENYINVCNQTLKTTNDIVENSEINITDVGAGGRLPALPKKPSAQPVGSNNNDKIVQHAIKNAKRQSGPGDFLNADNDENKVKNKNKQKPDMITEHRKKAKTTIEKAEPQVAQNDTSSVDSEILELAIRALPQGLLIAKDGKVQYHNPRFLQLCDLPEDTKLIGNPISEALSANMQNLQIEDKSAALQHALESLQNNETYTIEHTTNDNRIVKITGVAQENGLYLFICSDVSDLRTQQREFEDAKSDLEAALAQNKGSNERFRAFAESNSDWFWQMDSDLRFSYFSDTFEQVTGVEPIRLLGKTRKETGVPGVDPEVFQAHLADLEAHRPFRDFTHKRNRPDGSVVWLAISGNPVLDGDGKFEGYVGSGRDVTLQVNKQRELENAIQAAEAAERAKSEFLANMSHEIRTPMNGVMGMAELLAGTELDSKQAMFTDVIVRSGASLLTIINDILDFSKLDAGQLELDTAPFNLAEAIEDVATLVSAKVAEKDLELIVRISPALPDTIVGDVGRLRQIMTNLLGNAVKFTEKGHVYVNVDGSYGEDGMARLEFAVEDTGIGIPKDDCAKIFNKFNQVDTSATRRHEGTGLGLSIASSLINLMGGTIRVESELGKGSTFLFEIELPAEQSKPQKKHVIPGDMHGARILIIDDNRVNRSILSEQMIAWNFDSAAASSGREGLQLIDTILDNNLSLDLIILDYQMPVMSGGEVLQILRNNEATKSIPVLMLTSVDSSESNRELSALGIEGNLTKPVRSSLLLETILQIIAANRQKTENPLEEPVAETFQPEPEPELDTVPDPSLSPATDDVQKHPEPSEGLDILVAEDNEVNQIVFSQILEETGLDFKIAANGRLALATYKAHQPRLVLMDVSMPEMNGKEATRAIREYEKANAIDRIPIVGVTAHALKGDMEACLDAGMDDYLSKPVSPAKLVRKVEQWLKIDLSFTKAG